jgi:hypothetical protein
MILSTHGIVGSQITQFVGLLDLYPSAAAAYSLRKLRSAYTGSAIRVRRASDNTEQDIGFSNNQLDTSSLTSFCSGTNGFVTTWYDQSGNGRDVTQATAASQPQIISSGSVILENGKPCVSFDNHDLRTSTFTLSSQPITKIVVVKPNTTTNESYIDSSATNRGRMGGGSDNLIFAGTLLSKATKSLTQQLFYGLFNGASSQIVINGINQGSGDAGSQGLDQVILGNHPTNAVNFNGTMQEALVWASSQSSNRTGIESNINSYYAIY